jgi:hypothetical protein
MRTVTLRGDMPNNSPSSDCQRLRIVNYENPSSGGMFRTTTLITKNRIFVPVPDTLAEEFKIARGPKEFFVRFDVLSSPSA